MKNKLIIVGTGQLSQDVRFFVERYDLFDIVGYAVNKEYLKNDFYNNLPVYPVEHLEDFVSKGEVYFYVAISCFYYLNSKRRDMYLYLKNKGFKAANLISPKADINSECIGDGNWIGDYAYLDYQVTIGANNIIRNYAYIGHYSSIENHCFLGAKSCIAGNSKIGDQLFLGVAATIFNDVHIGNKCIVGGAAVAKKNMPDFSICKVSNDNMILNQYSKDTIENKLIPGSVHRAIKNKT